MGREVRLARVSLGPLLAWLAFLGLAPAAGAERPDEQAILRLEQRRFEAMVAADLPALQEILADDLTYVHSKGGTLETKAEFLERLNSGDLKYKTLRREEARVRFYGAAAVVTGRLFAEVRTRGEDIVMTVRYTEVLAEKDGRWRVVAWQTTRMD